MGPDYKLLTKNCLTFAQHLCQILEVAPVPEFIVRLPQIASRWTGSDEEGTTGEDGGKNGGSAGPRPPLRTIIEHQR